MTVEFKKRENNLPILNPMQGFQEDGQHVEIRFDPLTGVRRLFNSAFTDKSTYMNQPPDENLAKMIAEKTREGCFFCPENIEKGTPKFTPDFLPEGRFRRGDSWIFPNLFQIYEVSGVAIIGKDHFLQLDEFSPEVLTSFYNMIIDFYRTIQSRKPELKYAAFGMNYLPPAGSSVVHPHNPVFMSRDPFPYVDTIMKESENYLQKHSVNFWQDLINTEKELGERYVGKKKNVEWMSSFSPISGNEFTGVVPGKSNFLEFDDNDIEGIAQGITKILSFYKNDLQKNSFNYVVYSGPLGEKNNSFWSNIRITTRPSFTSNYVSDIPLALLYFMDNFFDNMPEYLASQLRDHF
ncbi:MAG: hypothetical protein SVY10_12355 [Thermodesulfobacteriota bacterium]|nr:hypothetical protein [Thermodesulfobacteriota bacterium]